MNTPLQPAAPPRTSRALSGIQPTGRFHWGNYFGAIRQYIDLQPGGGHQAADEAYYFIADLHALTTVRDPARLRALVHAAAIDLVALGLDPERAVLFVQSDVPEVTELTWLLMTVCPMGLLERCHAYKDKKTRGLPADAGLFTYPVLMAADILAYDATVVPVGEDQVQHIEVCRDLAGTFNHLYGEVFTLPRPRLVEGGAKVPGTDGQKISKSYEKTIARESRSGDRSGDGAVAAGGLRGSASLPRAARARGGRPAGVFRPRSRRGDTRPHAARGCRAVTDRPRIRRSTAVPQSIRWCRPAFDRAWGRR